MKRKNLILKLVLILFLSIVAFSFSYKYLRNIFDMHNEKKNLTNILSYINNYEDGKYILEDGNVKNENNEKLLLTGISGEGVFYKTKYGINAKIKNKYCLYKTSGNEEIINYKGNCEKLNLEIKEINYSMSNAQINLNKKGYYYITNKEEVPKIWKYSDNIIAYLPYEGEFYIWYKNDLGVIYDPVKLKVNCTKGEYDDVSKSIIYCTGSKINYMNYSWHVIKDENSGLTLLLDEHFISKMSHCNNDINNKYCYYKSKSIYESYKWSKSKINEYLNQEFIKNLDKSKLLQSEICDEPSGKIGCKDGDGCSGYLKEDIEKSNYKCDKYVTSYVRLLTYKEYNYLLKKEDDTSWIYNAKMNDFWLMNGYSKTGYFASKIDSYGNYYLDEISSKKLEVRAVITIKK